MKDLKSRFRCFLYSSNFFAAADSSSTNIPIEKLRDRGTFPLREGVPHLSEIAVHVHFERDTNRPSDSPPPTRLVVGHPESQKSKVQLLINALPSMWVLASTSPVSRQTRS
jgi:hypothetical protein